MRIMKKKGIKKCKMCKKLLQNRNKSGFCICHYILYNWLKGGKNGK